MKLLHVSFIVKVLASFLLRAKGKEKIKIADLSTFKGITAIIPKGMAVGGPECRKESGAITAVAPRVTCDRCDVSGVRAMTRHMLMVLRCSPQIEKGGVTPGAPLWPRFPSLLLPSSPLLPAPIPPSPLPSPRCHTLAFTATKSHWRLLHNQAIYRTV